MDGRILCVSGADCRFPHTRGNILPGAPGGVSGLVVFMNHVTWLTTPELLRPGGAGGARAASKYNFPRRHDPGGSAARRWPRVGKTLRAFHDAVLKLMEAGHCHPAAERPKDLAVPDAC